MTDNGMLGITGRSVETGEGRLAAEVGALPLKEQLPLEEGWL